jgi:SOS-response transcriptional repressor LexA
MKGDSMSKELTRQQERVFRFIFESTMRAGYQPSYVEVAYHFGWGNRTATQCHVLALRQKGYIGPGTNESRALRLLKKPDGTEFTGFVCKEGD